MKGLKKLTAICMTFAMALWALAGTSVSADAAPAPGISISAVATDSYDQQAFVVSVEGYSEYEAYVGGSLIEEGSFGAGEHYLSFGTSSAVLLQVFTQYDSNDDGTPDKWTMEQRYSAQSYYLTVRGAADDGRELFQETLLMDANNYPEYVYNAPAAIQKGDTVYTAERSQYVISYGSGNVTIPYTAGSLEAKTFTVSYLDEQDNALFTETRSLSYGETAELTAPASYEANGKTYQLTSAVRQYNVSYDNAAASYVFEYAEVIPAPEAPYEITINLVDEADGAVLYSIRQTVDVNSLVRVELPSTYEVNFKQYRLADGVDAFVEREFSSTRSTVYNIPYVVAEESAPYDITIRFVDYENPETVLSAMTATVTPDGEPYQYDISSNASLEINGVTYQVLAGQGNDNGQIVHTYGTSSRSYTVYYAAQEVEEPEAYTVTMRYISVSDNAVLETQQLQVAYGGTADFEAAPATLTVDGTEYTRLNGQEEAVSHQYNESQTSYAVYYMETESLAEVEVEPEVITQVITQYVTEDGTVIENADGTVVPDNVPVTTVTGVGEEDTNYNAEGEEVTIEEGEIAVIEEEEVPLAPTPETDGTEAAETEAAETAEETEGVQIEEEDVPLANAVPTPEDGGSSNGLIIGIGAGAAAVIALAAAILVSRKKKNA